MKTQRLKLLLLSFGLFSISVIVAGLFARNVIEASELLHEQVATLQQDREQQNRLTQLKRLIAETEDTRATIDSYYLNSQSDSIDFLNYIERLAQDQLVSLETVRATEEEEGGSLVLSVEYLIDASFAEINEFVILLENIPYVSEVTSVNLQNKTETNWQATVTLEVIVLEDHETTI